MKLYRFVGLTLQRATAKAHEQLGPNALIYSTRKIEDGIEILAGLPSSVDSEKVEEAITEEVNIHDSILSRNTFDKLTNQLDRMDQTIKNLSNHITMLNQMVSHTMSKKTLLNWDVFKIILRWTKKLKEGRYAKHTSSS